jgi:hypothetical protein
MAKRIKEEAVADENFAIIVLKDAEAVLIKRISRMREGKPRFVAQKKLREVQSLLDVAKTNV